MKFIVKGTPYRITFENKFYILESSYGTWWNRKWRTVYKSTNKTLFNKQVTKLLIENSL